MRTVTRGFIGMLSVVFLLGGLTLAMPLGSGVAQAAPPKGPFADHDAEMTAQHDMLQQDISDAQAAIAEVKALVEALEPGAAAPLCGAGTEGQRFHVSHDGTEVCDNTTGLHWEQNPVSSKENHAAALTHCPTTLGTGYRLPEVQELVGVVDYTTSNPAVNTSVFTNVQSSLYWSATTDAIIPRSRGSCSSSMAT